MIILQENGKKPRNYWTYEKCKEEALKYKSITEFQKNSNGSYYSSLKNNWLNDICKHMIQKRKPNGYWTYEKCKEESLKYKTITDLQKGNISCYNICYKNKWINELCNHMVSPQKPRNYWTYEKCKEESLKYDNRKDFKNKSKGCYSACYKNNWLDELCKHMIIKGNTHRKCIYSYEFEDNHVYVGLTYNLEKRHSSRLKSNTDQVTKHMNETNLNPIRKQLTDYINVNEAIKMEEYYVNKYKDDGWNILNKMKTGGIGGGNKIWTYEKCKEELLKYKNKKQLRINNPSVYTIIKNNKWVDILCSHMITIRKPNGYWTYEKCKEEALKYDNRKDFKENSSSAYNTSLKNNWLNDICKHMIQKRKPKYNKQKSI